MTSAIAGVIFLEVFMEKEKILEIVNEINKIARLNCMYNKIEEIGDNYDEFVEDFYRMVKNGYRFGSILS